MADSGNLHEGFSQRRQARKGRWARICCDPRLFLFLRAGLEARATEAEFVAAAGGEMVGVPVGFPGLFDDDVADSGNLHQCLTDRRGVAAGTVGEIAE